MRQIKGGDTVFWPEKKCFMLRQHTRSKVFFPIPHEGNMHLPVKLSEQEISTLLVLDAGNTPVIDKANYRVELLSLIGKLKHGNVNAQAVVLPLTTMESPYKQVIFVNGLDSVQLVAFNESVELIGLVEQAIEKLNDSNQVAVATDHHRSAVRQSYAEPEQSSTNASAMRAEMRP